MAKSPKRKTISASATVEKDGQLIEITVKPIESAVKNGDTLPHTTQARTNTTNNRSAVRATISHRRAQKAVDELLDGTDDLLKEQVGGFVNFIREHAVVGLAVGFIIGAQAQAVVKQLVASIIDPILKLAVGSSLSKATFHAGAASPGGADFGWGALLYAFINLFAVLTAIYILIKVLKLDKLDKKRI